MKQVLKYFLLYLLILLGFFFLLSCGGPTGKLRRAEKLIAKAEAQGLKWSVDTVFKTIEVITPKIEFDTVLKQVNFTDTITVTKDNVITRLKINTVTKEVFVSTECPSDTVFVKVPVQVKRKIEAGKGWQYYFWRGLGLVVMAFIAGYITRAVGHRQVNISFNKEKDD